MKKFLVAVFSIAMLASCTETKIGYVDMEEISAEYKEAKQLESDFQADQQQMQQTLQALSGAFQAKVQEYYQTADKLSANARQAKEQELQQEQQQIQQQQQQLQQMIQAKAQQRIEALTEKIDSVVKSYAKTNKFQLILSTHESSTVLYGADQLNVTEEVIDILNENYDNETETTEEVSVETQVDSTQQVTE